MKITPIFFTAIACLAQTGTQAAAPQLPAGVSVQRNLSYGAHPENVLDIFIPSNAPSKRRCGVLAIHGGGWINGTKEGAVQTLVVPWLKQGCVVANVGYRLARTAPAPAAVQDVLEAAQFFQRNAKKWEVDSDRIIATGASAGGHLALMVGLTPKSAKLGPTADIAAVVNFYGITDVEDQLGGPNMQNYAVTWLPESMAGRMELARRVSPITYARTDAPPVLTLHGTADTTVPYEHGVQLTKALRDAGADAELIPVSDAGHGFPREKLDQLYQQVFEFMRRREILRNAQSQTLGGN
jgi:acetyl esterase/lipase